ncbi:MAG: sigma-70 family RNA polymerase sigma factor [Planctomycetota bacterium]|nr:sigma-70 family RNA polymerase sigma factor [Planctomycetota bacterium]
MGSLDLFAAGQIIRHNVNSAVACGESTEMKQPLESNHETLDQFRSYLYLLARAHLGPRIKNNIDASDLVQQTLMDAHAKKNQFRGTTDAERAAWLRKILTRNLADAMRHQHRAKRDVSRERSIEAEIDGSFCRAESWLAASQSSPSQHATKKEELLRLADALTKLPEAQRDAVILRHLQGMALAEIAGQLDRSEAAVAGLIYRGLNKLHDLLDDESEA